MDGDAATAVVEFIDADDFAQGFLVDGAGGIGVGEGDEDAETLLVTGVFGDEIDAVESRVLCGQDFVKVGQAGFGRTHADDTRNFQAAFAAAFSCSQMRHAPLCTWGRVDSQALSLRKVADSIRAGLADEDLGRRIIAEAAETQSSPRR